MEIFNCYVPQKDMIMARDRVAVIFNYLRKKDREITNVSLETKIGKELRKRFRAAKGEKTFLEVAKEYYADLKKEDN